MNGDEYISLRELLADTLEDGEMRVVHPYLQLEGTLDFKIRCPLCEGGLSNPFTVFLDLKKHDRAMERLSPEEREVLKHYLIRGDASVEIEKELVGACMSCLKTLRATVLILEHPLM